MEIRKMANSELGDVERAKVDSAKRMIEQSGLDKARRLVREDKRDAESLKMAMTELTEEL